MDRRERARWIAGIALAVAGVLLWWGTELRKTEEAARAHAQAVALALGPDAPAATEAARAAREAEDAQRAYWLLAGPGVCLCLGACLAAIGARWKPSA